MDNLRDFVGQKQAIRQILALITDPCRKYWNVLIRGPYGYGKTTLALLVAAVVACFVLHQPINGKVAISMDNYIHIVDECHTIHTTETLYPIMEKQRLIFCTNAASRLPEPFISRCFTVLLRDYTETELGEIVHLHAGMEKVTLPVEVCRFIAQRCHRNPRTGVTTLQKYLSLCRLYRWKFDLAAARRIFREWGIDQHGFDHLDRKYLRAVSQVPVSRRTLQMLLNIDREEFNRRERFLVQRGLINITSRGRSLCSPIS